MRVVIEETLCVSICSVGITNLLSQYGMVISFILCLHGDGYERGIDKRKCERPFRSHTGAHIHHLGLLAKKNQSHASSLSPPKNSSCDPEKLI